MRVNRLASLTVMVLALLTPSVAAADSDPQPPPPPKAIRLPYWYVGPSTDSLLHLSLNSDLLWGTEDPPKPIPVTVSLKVRGTGTPVTFQVTVPLYGVIEIPLKAKLSLTNGAQAGGAWGNGGLAQSAWGTMTISLPAGYYPAEDILSVQAEIASVGTSTGHVLAASETSRLGDIYEAAVIRRPGASSRTYLVLQNDSDYSNAIYLSWNNRPSFATVALPAGDSASMIELSAGLQSGQVARIEANGGYPDRPFLGSLLTVDESLGVATLQPLQRSYSGVPTLQSPPIMLGGGWGGTVGLVNASPGTAQILPSINWYTAAGELRNTPGVSVSVPGNSGVLLSLAQLGLSSPTGQAALRFDEAGTGGHEIAGTVWNSNGGIAMPEALLTEFSGASSKSAVGFELGLGGDDKTAMIGGTNASNDPIDVTLAISYIDSSGNGRFYVPNPVHVEPGGFVLYDFRRLRDLRTPDSSWQPLPADLIRGSARLWASIPGALIARDATYSVAGGWAIQCAKLCGVFNLSASEPLFETPPCRSIGRLQFQLYGRVSFLPNPTLTMIDPEAGIATFKACPIRSWCGNQKPIITDFLSRSDVWGLSVAFAGLSISFPGIPIHADTCVQLAELESILFNPCPP